MHIIIKNKTQQNLISLPACNNSYSRMLLSILLLNQEILLVNCIFPSRLLICNNVSVTVGMLVERSIEMYMKLLEPNLGMV